MLIDYDSTDTGAKNGVTHYGLQINANDDSTTASTAHNLLGVRILADSDHSSCNCYGGYFSAAGLGVNYGV